MSDSNEFFNENFDDIFNDSDDSTKDEGESSNFDAISEMGTEIDSEELKETETDSEENKKKLDLKGKLKIGNPKENLTKVKKELSSYKDIKNLTENKFYNIIKVILLILVIIIVSATTLQRVLLKKQVEKDIIYITQTDFVGNLPSYIYINEQLEIDDNEVILEKILVDTDTTILYFDTGYNEIDLNHYVVYILDENNKFYGVQSTEIDLNEDEYIIPLNGLEPGITEFTINITNMYTEESILLAFKSDKKLKVPPSKYVDGDLVIKYNNDANLNLINAQFSPAHSSLDFLLETDLLSPFTYVIGLGNEQERVLLYEEGRRLRSIKSTEKVYEFKNKDTTLIKVDFNPVKSLNSKVQIIISEVYKKYNIDQIFGTRELLLKEIQDYHTIKLDTYDVQLEGMKRYDDKIVLVAHSVDLEYYDRMYPTVEVIQSKNYYDPIKEEPEEVKIDMTDPYANRVPVYIEATLLVHKSGEEPFEIKGEVRTAQQGTDVMFTDSRLRNTTSADYDLRIDNILFKIDDIDFELDLKKLDYNIDAQTTEYIEFIESSMINRLKYKSKEKVLTSITGFSDEVMNNNDIMTLYKPVDVISPARYDVTVDSYVYRDNEFLAIVVEQWNGITKSGFEHINNIHEIQVENTGGKLEIVYDKVIEKNEVSHGVND